MKAKKRRWWRPLGATALAVLMLVCFSTGVTAQSAWPREDDGDIHIKNHENIPVTVEGAYISDCYLINETTYAPLRSFCAALCDPRITYNAKTRVATVEANGLYLTARDGQNYICANGRYLYTDTPVKILDDGRMYVPIRLLSQALGVDVTWNASSRSVRISGDYDPILSGDAFYDADAVYWLSRIISAESRGEPLLGQIAVGNVVLNRVASKDYPNTIWGVIFDRRYGVQFTPVANGTVYEEPYYLSVIAAKLCLEGVTVSPRVLFFYEPCIATSFWIPANRPYGFAIGCHRFYY